MFVQRLNNIDEILVAYYCKVVKRLLADNDSKIIRELKDKFR